MEIGHKNQKGQRNQRARSDLMLASATSVRKISMETQKSPEIRNGDGLILGLSTAAGGRGGGGKNEGTHWPEV